MRLGRSVFVALMVVQVTLTGSAIAAETITVKRTDKGKTVTLRPEIHFPSGSGPFSAVVVVNSSSGAKDLFFDATIEPMTKAGIAVVLLDTFSPRGVGSTARDQSKVSSTQMGLDALHVADALRRDKRFKSNKIALQGQSKGGVTALHVASQGWRRFAGASKRPFDAAIAIAASCELQFEDPKLASPLLGLMGEKDDNTLPGPCVNLFKRMKAAGQPVDWEVVAGAYHSWSSHGTYYQSDLFSIRRCADEPHYYTRQGFKSSKTGKVIPFRAIFKKCGARGYTIGGPHDKRPYVLKKAVGWLKQQGW